MVSSPRGTNWERAGATGAQGRLSSNDTRLAPVQRPRSSTLSCHHCRSRTAATFAAAECALFADHGCHSPDCPDGHTRPNVLDTHYRLSSAEPGRTHPQSRGIRHYERVFYILAIDATLTILMATLPTGIRNSNIPDFDLFIIPTLIGGVVLPRRFVPLLAALHICITIALFTLLPYDPLLTQEITLNQKGFAYAELSDAFLIQIVGATIAWLGAWSVDRALLRASRAEEVAEARKRLNEQAQQIVAQKHRLDYGMSILKEAQARFANGDYTARVKLQDNELTPLALSFNLLAERLYRITQIAQEYTRLEQALQQLFEIQNTLFYGGPLKPYPATGTLVDHLYFSFQRYDQLRHSVDKGGSSVERVRRELTQQKLLLTQLDTILAQTHAVVRLLPNDTHRPHLSSVELIEKAQQVSTQITGQEMKLLEQLLRGR
jgi:hypothetical protein